MTRRSILTVGGACAATLVSLAAQAAPDTFTATRVDRPPEAVGGFYGLSLADNGAVVAEAELPVLTKWYTGANGIGVYDRPAVLVGKDVRYIGRENSRGQVMGTYMPGAHQGEHGFLTSPDGNSLVDYVSPAGGPIAMDALDDEGRTAGEVDNKVPFRANAAGRMRPMVTFGKGYPYSAGMRNGVVVGFLSLTDTDPVLTHAWRTGADGLTLVDLGTLVPGGKSWATAINAAGSVVGYATDAAGFNTAVRTEPGGTTFMALDTESVFDNSVAEGIDRKGHVAGEGILPGDSNWTPFITGAGGVGLHDLNKYVRLPNGSHLTSVVGVNDRGQILAADVLPDDGPWLLTPTRDTWAEEIEAP